MGRDRKIANGDLRGTYVGGWAGMYSGGGNRRVNTYTAGELPYGGGTKTLRYPPNMSTTAQGSGQVYMANTVFNS